jgi:DNA modification methylase
MHRQLDRVWARCAEALGPGGFMCVNVGDATRTVAGEFGMYPNHARVIAGMMALGLTPLPDVLWRKPTNAPNKFLGSGVLPAGAYVTYEHEYVLIFRKGGKRAFPGEAAARRAASAVFWEERNVWFSDLWADLPGAGQRVSGAGRARSGAFPFELPWRLIHMHSVQGDLVLDPFAGTGTTLAAALAAGRSSVGVELDPGLRAAVDGALRAAVPEGQRRAAARLRAHADFVAARAAAGKAPAHVAASCGLPVVSRQEAGLQLVAPTAIEAEGTGWAAIYAPVP